METVGDLYMDVAEACAENGTKLYKMTSLGSFIVYVRLRANGRNNSQHCYANNVGSCCVRVGSDVQTDVTTSNNVGTCSASWEGYNP